MSQQMLFMAEPVIVSALDLVLLQNIVDKTKLKIISSHNNKYMNFVQMIK